MSKAVTKKTWFNIANGDSDDTAEVMIYDVIGEETDWMTGKNIGIGSSQFAQDFAAIKAKVINVRINSIGGNVFEGFAIANAIKDHKSTVNVKIDSLAASISAVIAMAGDTVAIAKNGYLMIHDPLCMCFGNSEDLRKEADQLDKLANTIGQTFADKSGKSIEDVRAKMRDETWFDSKDAKEFGLVDSISSDDDDDEDDEDNLLLNSAMALRAVAKYKKAPERLRRYAASLANPYPERQTQMAEKIITRDGKHFVKFGDKELEIDVAGSLTPPKNKVDQPDVEAIKREAAKEAVAAEQKRRQTFNTILSTANVKGKDAEELEKFYAQGMPEDQLKFLAQRTIGARAAAVGEGSGDDESKPKNEAEKAAKEVTDYCTKRFANDARMRRQFKVTTTNAADENYKAGLARFVAVETKCRADENRASNSMDDEPNTDGDPISRIMKNRSVFAAAE